ncbi:hypothetical protein N7520_006916 [Penicillium odoratum]|uniref:uncharacterized protein n=1 Tax=Penicillium odoratum TaxID=1167516 RepID=UPI0025468A80|nr:uncharacterized protein N7520_006916 [Penicillium odoratum]KAJ5759760.1 hypothetical protein N7520_006916 [Penicillium odoratum]
MAEGTQIQHPEFFNPDSGAGPPQSVDPRNSLEDYNRTMLDYTQRQMSTFVDLDGNSRNGTSSRNSQSSSNSGNSGNSAGSSNGVLASQANGPPPTSAGSSADSRDPIYQARMKAMAPNQSQGY